MTGYSLRRRLLAGMAAWVALSLIATGVALALLFTIHVELDLQMELEASLERMVAKIEPDVAQQQFGEPLTDPRFDTPFGGLYWQVEDLTAGRTYQSRSLWDVNLTLPEALPAGLFTMPGPSSQSLAVVSRRVVFDSAAGARPFRVTIAQDRAFTDDSIASFRTELTIALLAVAGTILLAGWALIELGLRPVRRLGHEIERIRAGMSARLLGPFPRELAPLVGQLNELLADRENSIERARSRAADLAHALRTPLSVIAATADRLRKSGHAEDSDLLEDVVAEMSVRTDYQLRLARLRLRGGPQVLSASLNGAVLRTLSVLRKTEIGEARFWRVDLGPDCTVDIDRYDLLELVGNLLENASKWARSRIDLSSARLDGMAELCISDDGPGMTPAQIAALGVRGIRLDEHRSGSGFGLAISMEIVTLNRGTLDLGRSDHGGLLVKVRLPLSAAPPPQDAISSPAHSAGQP